MDNSFDDEILLTTPRFSVEQVTYESDGKQLTKAIIRHPGAAAILPLLPNDQICLIRNHRPSADEVLFEIPAGTLEPPEPADIAAARELAEETGYRAGSLQKIHQFYVSPGILDEQMYLYLASDLQPGDTALEPGERIENFIVDREEALAMIDQGKIRDAKTIVALLFYDRHRDTLPIK